MIIKQYFVKGIIVIRDSIKNYGYINFKIKRKIKKN